MGGLLQGCPHGTQTNPLHTKSVVNQVVFYTKHSTLQRSQTSLYRKRSARQATPVGMVKKGHVGHALINGADRYTKI